MPYEINLERRNHDGAPQCGINLKNRKAGADDFDKLEIIIMAEDYFGLEISDDDASHIRTVGDLLDLVQRKQRAAA